MYKSFKITISSKTVPKLIWGTPAWGTTHNIEHVGNVNDPNPVLVYNAGANTILIGGETTALCVFPLLSKTSIPFGVNGEDALFGKLTTTGTTAVYVLIGRQ